MMGETILVTGGAGFIGSNLCKALLGQGNRVICVDNFFTGTRKNMPDLSKHPNFRLIPHDITDPRTPIDVKVLEQVDKIYNLACPASPIHYQFDSIQTVKANTIGVINILEFAKLTGARILQASTSEIYGDPLEHPQVESYWGNVNTIGPRSCYDEGKRVAETLFSDYHRIYGVDIRIARIFNTYGINMEQNDGRVVSNFIVQSLQNKPITIYGDGKQTRSFCFVPDLVDGLIRLMDSDYKYPVNLGNPDERSILNLAETIIKLTKSKSKLVFKSLPINDPLKRKPNISLAKKELGWEPKIKIEEGLSRTIAYFKERYSL